MNTRGLSYLYDQLSPSERLPLIIAAEARGDAVEKQRLMRAAPQVVVRVSDYHFLAKALTQAVDFHLHSLLDLAARFWQAWGVWMTRVSRCNNHGSPTSGRSPKGDVERLKEWRMHGLTRYYAARFVANRDGWKQFCGELNIDPEVQLEFMIGWDLILQTDEAARDLAFSAEEAKRFVLLETTPADGSESLERGPADVEKVEELVEGWHKILEKLVIQEGGSNYPRT